MEGYPLGLRDEGLGNVGHKALRGLVKVKEDRGENGKKGRRGKK